MESALEKLAETGWAAEGLSKEQLEVTQEVRPVALLQQQQLRRVLPPFFARCLKRKFRLPGRASCTRL